MEPPLKRMKKNISNCSLCDDSEKAACNESFCAKDLHPEEPPSASCLHRLWETHKEQYPLEPNPIFCSSPCNYCSDAKAILDKNIKETPKSDECLTDSCEGCTSCATWGYSIAK